jgi:hypothetical protein
MKQKRQLLFFERGRATFSVAVFTALVFLSAVSAQAGTTLPTSKWDRRLLSLELQNVHIHAKALEEVWQRIMLSQMGVRSVLCLPDALRPAQKQEFKFDQERCTVLELLQALERAYPDFMYTQDTNTGIIWLHPKDRPYEGILAAKVKVEHDAIALRMREDVMEDLFSLAFPQLKLFAAYPERNAEYPVDLPAGTYSVRDILNICCVANPGRTFCVQPGRVEPYCNVQPLAVTGFNPKVHEVSPGALAYWRTEFDETAQTPPSAAQLVDVLAANDGRVRAKARRYLDLTLSISLKGDPTAKATSLEQVVWFDVAALGVSVRMDLGGPISITESARLKKALKEEDWSGKPGLKALAAMEVARIERDTTFLEQVAKQPLTAAEIADAKYDMIRITRLSEFLRNKLLELNPPWVGFSKGEIEALTDKDIFSLP